MTNSATVHITVPASSANLGPGYDSFGLALGRFDELAARRVDVGLTISVSGVGAGQVPTDERHLVIRAADVAFATMGVQRPGLAVDCHNTIPHGGGQGSSAAAIVAGILLARAMVDDGAERLSGAAVFDLATAMEGHPDNVAPVLFGGFTVAWMEGRHARAIRLAPHPALRAVVFSADASCATEMARAALPAMIPHADAAANSARAALLTHAITSDPSLLLAATEDYLHQRYRETVMPETATLLHDLRERGLAATLSGAGPAILLLGADLPPVGELAVPGFTPIAVTIPVTGAEVDGVPFAATPAGDDVA